MPYLLSLGCLQGYPNATDWARLDPASNHARLLHSVPGAQMLPAMQVI